MSLNPDALKNGLLSAFRSMRDNDDFANGIAEEAANYTGSGDIATTDAGTIPAGVFTGTGTGGATADGAACAGIIKAACNAMESMTAGGNAYLAAKLAGAVEALVSGCAVETDVTGQAVPPSGSPVPVSGTASGTMTGTAKAAMEAAFLKAFTSMDGMTSGGDEYLAGEMAGAITAYYTSATVSTQGTGPLAGSAGTGSMT